MRTHVPMTDQLPHEERRGAAAALARVLAAKTPEGPGQLLVSYGATCVWMLTPGAGRNE
jgi:hypothetical protein